jgi:glucoamylase
VRIDNGQVIQEEIVDASSLFGLWYFGMLEQSDPLFQATLRQVQTRLSNPGQTKGVIRYENDAYFRSGEKPNPWIITTLWEAQRRLHLSEVSQDDLAFVRDTLEWVVKHQFPSGVLAEQLDPETGSSLSATPLVWSHAVYVETVMMYIRALEKKGLCVQCQATTS